MTSFRSYQMVNIGKGQIKQLNKPYNVCLYNSVPLKLHIAWTDIGLHINMSFVVTSILSSTVGLLYNKARDKTANRLKDGDITDVKIREIVVRELNDIKFKLDGLGRKDLLSSYRFLKEGVDLLNVALDISNDEENGVNASSMSNAVERSTILNDAFELSNEVQKLKFKSDNEYETAKKRFEDARKTATHAFCNEALSIKDRIFAAKLRVASEVLECLETPNSAITGCLSFLHDLHSLPAIREIFSVYLNGGIKSRLNRAERMDTVRSVMMINYVMYQFNFKFCRKRTVKAIWPIEIKLADRSFNPILHWQEVSSGKLWGREVMQPRNELLLEEHIWPSRSALKISGDIVAVSARSTDDLKLISKRGESMVTLTNPKGGNVSEYHIQGLAVDNNNNVYIVRCHEKPAENADDLKFYVLHVLDETCNVKHQYTLDFLKVTGFGVNIALNNNNDIVMIKNDDPFVYVCDNTGHLIHKFKRDSDSVLRASLTISNNNDIVISSSKNRSIDIYTNGGNLKSIVKLPEGHKVVGLAFHHDLGKIVVLSLDINKESYYILCYPGSGGDLETSTFFSKRNAGRSRPNIISKPGVPITVIEPKRVIYI
ncbi:uncharacterized protein LOC114517047 [Dendronephthya gigantea]|uniref:uncharacterized protein LOC114517047 n=1 Tax=Dendronephthya gigantea TaxID=151771 RepID=UPI00106C2D3C|nr:uncharacterized protein LOC114517047 [Dendronephthya gigantea]